MMMIICICGDVADSVCVCLKSNFHHFTGTNIFCICCLGLILMLENDAAAAYRVFGVFVLWFIAWRFRSEAWWVVVQFSDKRLCFVQRSSCVEGSTHYAVPIERTFSGSSRVFRTILIMHPSGLGPSSVNTISTIGWRYNNVWNQLFEFVLLILCMVHNILNKLYYLRKTMYNFCLFFKYIFF